jgi:hypothetical protein
MPREGEVSRTYLIFGDIEGKLDVLRVESPSAPARAAKNRPQGNHDEMEGTA